MFAERSKFKIIQFNRVKVINLHKIVKMTRKWWYCYYIYKWKDQQRRDSQEEKVFEAEAKFLCEGEDERKCLGN